MHSTAYKYKQIENDFAVDVIMRIWRPRGRENGYMATCSDWLSAHLAADVETERGEQDPTVRDTTNEMGAQVVGAEQVPVFNGLCRPVKRLRERLVGGLDQDLHVVVTPLDVPEVVPGRPDLQNSRLHPQWYVLRYTQKTEMKPLE